MEQISISNEYAIHIIGTICVIALAAVMLIMAKLFDKDNEELKQEDKLNMQYLTYQQYNDEISIHHQEYTIKDKFEYISPLWVKVTEKYPENTNKELYEMIMYNYKQDCYIKYSNCKKEDMKKILKEYRLNTIVGYIEITEKNIM